MVRLHAWIAVLVFAALTAVVSIQVLNRLVLHQALIWSEELARFLFFWVALLGAALSVRRRRHFVLDVSLGRPPRRRLTRAAVTLFPDACVLAFCALLLVEGVSYTHTGLARTATNSELNMAMVYAAIPVFAVLSLVYAAANLLADWRRLRQRGTPPAEEPPPGE